MDVLNELVANQLFIFAKTKSSKSFPQIFFLIGRFALTQTPGGAPPGPPRWATIRVAVINSQTRTQ